MKRILLTLCLILPVSLGCTSAQDPGSKNVLFTQIEGAVQDLNTAVSSKNYSGDTGDDRLGMALVAFEKSVAGKPIEADVKRLSAKVTEVTTLAAKRPKIDVLRKAVKELVDVTDEVKKKL